MSHPSKRKVVITGLGVLSAAGEGYESLWACLEDKRSCVSKVNLKDLQGDANLPDFLVSAAKVPSFEPEKYIANRKSLKVMARDIQLAVAAASLAVKDAGVSKGDIDPFRFGIVCGSGVLDHDIEELYQSFKVSFAEDNSFDYGRFGQDGIGSLFPLWLLKYLPNMPACHISILHDLQGPNNTITTGASSSLQAIGEAFRIIERGSADQMLAGGADAKVNPLGVAHYQILTKGQETHTLPVVGEAAAFLMLEEYEHAKKRGAKIYGFVESFSSTSCDAPEQSMGQALKEASLTQPGALNAVMPSGGVTMSEKQMESRALQNVLSDASSKIVNDSSKAFLGYCGFASGALDSIAAIQAIYKKNASNILVHSFGFGSPSACLVLRGQVS